MCGRYVLEGPVSRLTAYFDARYTEEESRFKNSYNIAPTTWVPVVRINREGKRVILNHVWGLIPHWAKDKSGSAKLNNARGETVHEKPSFRTAFKKFRCLIPASGYFEWQAPPEGSGNRKQPRAKADAPRPDIEHHRRPQRCVHALRGRISAQQCRDTLRPRALRRWRLLPLQPAARPAGAHDDYRGVRSWHGLGRSGLGVGQRRGSRSERTDRTPVQRALWRLQPSLPAHLW